MRLRGAFLAVVLSLSPALVFAQGIQPSGSHFTPGHTVRVLNSQGTAVGDAGGAAGSAIPGSGYLSELGITNTGCPFAINDAPTNAPGGYHALSLCSNALGTGAELSYNAFGGAVPLPLNCNVNGTITPCGGLPAVPNAPSIATYGGVADNSTDLGAAIQKAYNANVGCVRIPAGIYLITTAVRFTAQPPCFFGDGWNENVLGNLGSATGTWIHINSTGFTPFTVTAIGGQGGATGFSNIAFYEDQPNVQVGWTPTAYPYIFTLNGNLGRVDFDNLLFFNTTHCISTTASARFHITNISGQPLGTCFLFDNEHDIQFVDDIDFWPFWNSTQNVVGYTQTNVDPLVYQRVDSPVLGKIFVYGYHSGLNLASSANGVTSGMQVSSLDADAAMYGLWVTGNASQAQIGNLRTAGGTVGGTNLAGAEGYLDASNGSVISISNFQCFYAGSNCVALTGSGSVQISNPLLWNFNNDNNGSAGLNAGTGGTIATSNPPSVINPQNGASTLPASPPVGGTYMLRGVRQNWTPTLATTNSNGTFGYAYHVGRFWYDGSNVTFNFSISATISGSPTGNAVIQGLPFTFNQSTNENNFCYIGSMSGITLDTNYTTMTGALGGGGGVNQVVLLESASGQSTVPVPIAKLGASLIIQGECVMAVGQ